MKYIRIPVSKTVETEVYALVNDDFDVNDRCKIAKLPLKDLCEACETFDWTPDSEAEYDIYDRVTVVDEKHARQYDVTDCRDII